MLARGTSSWRSPIGNITGVSFFASQLEAKRIATHKLEYVPRARARARAEQCPAKGGGGRLAADFSILPAMRRGAAVAASVASGAVASVALAAPWGSPFRV